MLHSAVFFTNPAHLAVGTTRAFQSLSLLVRYSGHTRALTIPPLSSYYTQVCTCTSIQWLPCAFTAFQWAYQTGQTLARKHYKQPLKYDTLLEYSNNTDDKKQCILWKLSRPKLC